MWVWHWVFKEGSSRMLSKIIGRITRKKFARQSGTWKGRLDDFREMVENTYKERNFHESVVEHWVIVKNLFEDLRLWIVCERWIFSVYGRILTFEISLVVLWNVKG